MQERKILEFKCFKCGSNRLARTKRVNCITPVEIIRNGKLNYDPTVIINIGDFSSNNEMFCCKDCEKVLYYHNGLINTEKRLWEYLEYCADACFQADSTEEHTINLMARVEEDGFMIRNSKEDM